MRALLIALQFLTILPVRLQGEFTAQDIGRSLLFYPVVGLLIGIVLSLLGWNLTSQSPMVSAILVLAVWVTITGALHIDGLADSADAWLGGIGDKAKTLSIMKDPAAGPIAVVTIVLVLLIKFVMLTVLLAEQNWWALIWSVILARTALPLLFLTTDYVRPHGLGSILKQQQSGVHTRRLMLLIGVLALFSVGLFALLFGLLVFLLLRYLMERRLNGFTGDTAGAMVELLETALLIFFVLF
ncbi:MULTISPECIES: adenosylcobinamide-GDP ribazoletransferase [unclassified Methylophaga]|jgi:adenosylcobinamide-GDP ribazoletransferase|uniref:adenosylcobinamide-GDP ribazoletransferase n=1 Tax=unclassified Methylophaga TaxID=2629249 RepID=UPI000C950BD5|nr:MULTISPECIES: adenosylcobinamide-GDP ribazoletransferase [unclassified Methylophaga]MAP25366.1 adenosylcobinamide-GDP ribazoletransferase [Methylophaga sp.]HCN99140.1 adenosylcobinamide-GDP ribazoletransferase [Methylophaga sp.]|tara:strand:+ start:188909 stop:189631 length:723 start_codon:yes stop_codon:yes gene_type:complete